MTALWGKLFENLGPEPDVCLRDDQPTLTQLTNTRKPEGAVKHEATGNNEPSCEAWSSVYRHADGYHRVLSLVYFRASKILLDK